MPRKATGKRRFFEVSDHCWEDADTIVYCGEGHQYIGPILVRAPKLRFPDSATIARLKKHYEVAKNLSSGITVQPISLESYGNACALVLEDGGARPLGAASGVEKRGIEAVLRLGIAVIDAIDALHGNNVIHGNLTTQNLWVDPDSGTIRIFDLSRAAVMSNALNEDPHTWRDADIRFVAPELFGGHRSARDGRSDYYAFGVVLFQCLTGRLPFDSADPEEILHAHLAQSPPSLITHNPEVPAAVEAIVLKLLAKDPAERYQSALGLRTDLRTCLTELQDTGCIRNLSPGRADPPRSIEISDAFYGRKPEIAILTESIDRVSQGSKEIVLVAGPPGIGKSALISELRQPVAEKHGYFISGKFDQYRRNVPYASVVQAFEQLISTLLCESDARIRYWRTRLKKALGVSGRVIADVIPEIERIVGAQPPVQELAPLEAGNRFNQIFRDLTRVFASEEHPLCILMDDLQWADPASLSLLEVLLTDSMIGHIMVLGAYRDNDVSASHPTMLTMSTLEQAGLPVTTLQLAGLDFAQVNDVIVDTFRCVRSMGRELAEHVLQMTEGNPFFVRQLLKSFYEKDLVAFDRGKDEWTWDIKRIAASGITDDVVELMRGKMANLPPDAQRCLMTAACLGGTFDLAHLSRASAQSARNVIVVLEPSLDLGLVAASDDSGPADSSSNYSFIHDRVQQAAYALIPKGEVAKFRLEIGRRLLTSFSQDETPVALFEIVDNLNYGSELISTQTERYKLAHLNLTAGRTARESLAYLDALNYLRVGLRLIQHDSWERDYSLTFELHKECFECEYQTGNFSDADALFKILLENATSTVDKAQVYYTKILLNTCAGRNEEAVRMGIEALQLFRIRFPFKPSARNLFAEIAKAKFFMMRRNIEDFAGLPPMTDVESIAATRILMGMCPVAYFVDPNITMLAGLRILTTSMKHGNAPVSAIGYVLYGLALGAVLNDIPSGHAFGRLAMKLSARQDNISVQAKVLLIFGGFLSFWHQKIDTSVEILRKAFTVALDAGDLQYADYAALQLIFLKFARGTRLEAIAAECDRVERFVADSKDTFAKDSLDIWRQSVHALRGETEAGTSLATNGFDEADLESRLRSQRNLTTLGYYLIRKLQLAYLFREYDAAYRYGCEAEKFVELLPGQVLVAEHSLYFGLTLAAMRGGTRRPPRSLSRSLARCRRRLRRWSKFAPENFEHMCLLLEAEASSEDSTVDVLALYDKAGELAREQTFHHIEALAAENAAAYNLKRGRIRIAQTYLLDAINACAAWGATAKLRQLEDQAAADGLLLPANESIGKQDGRTTAPPGSTYDVMELNAVRKTSKVLAEEMELADLLGKLMTVLQEIAGAQRGAIILRESGQLKVHIVGGDSESGPLAEPSSVEDQRHASPAVVNYVARTGSSVILEDSISDYRFASCRYLREHRPRSVLCTPIVRRGETAGVLYLENNLIEGAFTSDRLELLHLVTTDAAIAIENARIYGQMRKDKGLLHAAISKAELLERIETHLKKFVPLPVQRLINENPDAPDLESHRRDISVLFLDIAGYTRMSEQLEIEKVTRLIEHYFSSYLNDIHRNGGDINQTAGDGMMILFQEPEVHAVRAVDTALAIKRKTEAINRKLTGEHPPITVNFGINTGVAAVGSTKIVSMTSMLWTYTASGSVVNLAARIGAFASDGAVVISESTAQRLDDRFILTPLGNQSFKNVAERVPIYRVEDWRAVKDPD